MVFVEAEIVEPKKERPTEGFFLFNVDLSPMATPAASMSS